MALDKLLSSSEWLVEEQVFDPEMLGFHETIFTLGNGYQGTRGAFEEGIKGEYAATYLAGVVDDHDSSVIELVNAPNWLPLTIWVKGERLSMQNCRILKHRRALDLRNGLLYRLTVFENRRGYRTRYESIRYVSLSDQHLCSIRVNVMPENYDGILTVESGINGERYNLDRLPVYTDEPVFHPEVKWEKWAKSKHLQFTNSFAEDNAVYLEMETIHSRHRLGYATSLICAQPKAQAGFRLDYEKVWQTVSFEAHSGTTYTLDKNVAIYTSRDVARAEVQKACLNKLHTVQDRGFEANLQDHLNCWTQKWADSDCIIGGHAEAARALRFNIYHLLIMANPHDPKVNIGAKSLSGEGYKGHVFWDTEIFLLPFYIYTQPETARALLLYRYYTLSGAIENAKTNGFSGAQYAWESADSGLETTPKWTADGAHRIWTGEEEIHITADVAYGILTYLNATQDWDFFNQYGAEILFQTARFWESRLEYNVAQDRYELNRVIGPDEYHEHVDNSFFTNWLSRWNLQEAAQWYDWQKTHHANAFHKIVKKIAINDETINRWQKIADKIYLPSDPDNKLIEEFEGYFQRKEVPITEWDENDMPLYPAGYDEFNAGETTLLKQPDIVMLMYVLPDAFDDETKRINYEFYEQRTLHKSSLSPCIHAIMGIEVGDTKKAVQYFLRSALCDLIDNQGNTEWGMHAASAGGTWQNAVFGFGGFRVKNGQMTFKPWLPPEWELLQFKIKWRGSTLQVTIKPREAVFYLDAQVARTEEIVVFDQVCSIPAGQTVTIPLSRH